MYFSIFIFSKFEEMKKIFFLLLVYCHHSYAQNNCDNKHLPIIFIHGFMASGDTYAKQIQRFKERMYCSDRLFVFDWNSVGGNGKKTDSLLSTFINEVLAKTGASQIDLVGHSAGGGLGRGYLIDSVNAAKVAHYIHLGSRKWFYEYSWFPNRKCLNIYSDADKIMGSMGGDVEGAVNLKLKDKDHYEVATSMETFQAMYKFLNDNNITTDAYAIFETIKIGGKALLLGDNKPLLNAKVNIYRLNEKSGLRLSQKPDAAFITDTQGTWGTFAASRKHHYEIELIPEDITERTISYFFETFQDPDELVYLRGIPKASMISAMLGKIPNSIDQSLIIIYSANKAMLSGRDSVTVNGTPITSPLLTPASRTVISSFIFDDGDNKTSGNALKQFSISPFLGGVDISLPVNTKNGHVLFYNGRKLVLPAVSSKQRILLAVFK